MVWLMAMHGFAFCAGHQALVRRTSKAEKPVQFGVDRFYPFSREPACATHRVVRRDQDVSHDYLVRALPTTGLINERSALIARVVGPCERDEPGAVQLLQSLKE